MRNRLLANPEFQRWAADFPLTRPTARRRAQDLFDLVAGFVYSQTLAACVRLGVFELLRRGARSKAELAEGLDLPNDALGRLLSAAEALELVERVAPSRYALGRRGAALLGNAGLGEMIEHHEYLYADLADSVALLRRGQGSLATYWPYATSDTPTTTSPEAAAAYSRLMAASLPTAAADILQAYPVRHHKRLLDVGGGEGAFLLAAGAAAPKLELALFDLPAVTERARVRLGGAGVLRRTRIVAGDFLKDALPTGADLVTLVRILHDHSDAGALTILRAVRSAIAADGALLIAEPMSGAGKPDRISGTYFAFYLLAMGRGRTRTPNELFDLLREAGFRRMRTLSTRAPGLLRAILAKP